MFQKVSKKEWVPNKLRRQETCLAELNTTYYRVLFKQVLKSVFEFMQKAPVSTFQGTHQGQKSILWSRKNKLLKCAFLAAAWLYYNPHSSIECRKRGKSYLHLK